MKKTKSFLGLSQRDVIIVLVVAVVGMAAGLAAVLVGSHSKDSMTGQSHTPSDAPVTGGVTGSLSRNSYDNTVKAGANNVVSQIAESISNNMGQLPNSQSDVDKALSTYYDPDVTVRYVSSFNESALPPNSKTFYYLPHYACQNRMPVQSTNAREFAVIGTLSSGEAYCVQL